MRKQKKALPLIVLILAVVLAVLMVLPVKSYGKVVFVPGKTGSGGIPSCLCGAEPHNCSCVYIEEPTG